MRIADLTFKFMIFVFQRQNPLFPPLAGTPASNAAFDASELVSSHEAPYRSQSHYRSKLVD